MIFTEDREEMTALGRQIIADHPELYPPALVDMTMKKCGDLVPDEDELRDIICRGAYCQQLYGSSIDEFLLFSFDKWTHRERMQYVTENNHKLEIVRLNRRADRHLLTNKFEAYTLLKPFYKREAMLLSGESDYDRFCAFAAQNKSLFVKPHDLSRALGAHRLTIRDGDDLREVFSALLAESRQYDRPMIIEDEIIQSPEMARFNPAEMSILRVYTVLVRGKVHFFYPCIRLMCGDGVTKCGEDYSIDALIDAETGQLVTDGLHSFGQFECHPVTGVRIKGTVLPEWDDMKQMLTDAALRLPTLRFIGWDVAHSTKGWCIIEGNTNAAFFTQLCVGHGVRKEFRRLIRLPIPPELWRLPLPLCHGYCCYWLILGKRCYQIKGALLKNSVRFCRHCLARLRGR